MDFLASYGSARSLIGAVIASIIGAVLIGIGIWYLTMRETATINGVITNASTAVCDKECKVTVRYEYDTKQYVFERTYPKSMVRPDDPAVKPQLDVPLIIYKDKPAEIASVETPSKGSGIGMIIGGLIIIIIAWVIRGIIVGSPVLSSLSGLQFLAGDLRNIWR